MKKHKIMIVDDDPSFLEITAAILRRFGYDVTTANSTAGVPRSIEVEKPDLLILDIMMATMDEGLELAVKLRQKKGLERFPIIIVSAQPDTEKGYGRSVEEDMDWIAADIFMEKPVDPQALNHNIQLLLEKRTS
ncbi:MAG: response regulator [Syntrophobacteraceae bacterium]|jgi:CheY-like chemotaxis protein|nr:response regulator [Syntrophobacteraceae bacterium]